MTVQAQDLITEALESIGVYAPGETVATNDLDVGLYVLNMVLDQFANEQLFVQQLESLTLNLSNGVSQYTIGPNGSPSLVAQRPNAVEYGPGVGAATSSLTTNQVNSVSAIEWNSIYSLSSGTGCPDTMFYDPQYPVGKINVAPTPTGSGTLTFDSMIPLTSFPTLSTSATLAPGVQNAIQNNLALSLISYFKDATNPPPRLMADAAEGKDFLRYDSMTSRAMLKRRMISTGRQPAPAAPAPASGD